MARTTRTTNPLPFADLHWRRFEDLVRQLAWDFRVWQSMQAIGRSGSDEGIDIRAIEAVDRALPTTLEVDTSQHDDGGAGRLWIIQCKNEESIGPKRVRSIFRKAIAPADAPYGFILAARCNFSKYNSLQVTEGLGGVGEA